VVQNRKPTSQALQLIALFIESDNKGLVPEDYDASRCPARIQKLHVSQSDTDLANFDMALTVSSMRFIRALHIGRVNSKALGRKIEVSNRKYDLGEFVYDKAIHASNPADAVKSVEPTFPGYLRTLDALYRYREFAKVDSGTRLSIPLKPILPVGSYADLPRLIQLLRLVGDPPASIPVDVNSTKYEGPIVDAVNSYQVRHGEIADGHLNIELIKELDVPMEQRVRQIELTLERWRWMEHSSSQPPVLANMSEFKLRTFDDEFKVALFKTVIVGKAYGHKSPVSEKEIKYVVFRQYWEVTPTIQGVEIVPHVKKDGGYITKKNVEVVTPDGNLVTDGVINDSVLAQLKSGKLYVRQKPGPTNSFGLIKLIFPNDDNFYLHGIETPQLFYEEQL